MKRQKPKLDQKIFPEVACLIFSMISMVVVFPAPLGPSSPQHDPLGIAKDTSSTALKERKDFVKLKTSRMAVI